MKNFKWVLPAIYILITLAATIIQFLKPDTIINDVSYPPYNNYIIFKTAFFHLIEGENLYAWHVAKHWDLFRYSPTFALFMGMFAFLPDLPGMLVWNLLNSMALFWAVYTIPLPRKNQNFLLLAFIVIELITSLQNLQSNALMAALMIACFNNLEKGKPEVAALTLALSVFIKLFGGLAFLLFVFYPNKLRLILWTGVWGVLLFVLPVVVTGIDGLVFQYENWYAMLLHDQETSYGYSVMGWLYSWFGVETNKSIILILGFVLLLLPYLNIKEYRKPLFRTLSLASILIWVVIFNHKAESPTFIIAICGVAIWFFSQKKTLLHWSLIILAFIFTSLSATDLFPTHIRMNYINPYAIKAVPCILIWAVLTYELMFGKYKEE